MPLRSLSDTVQKCLRVHEEAPQGRGFSSGVSVFAMSDTLQANSNVIHVHASWAFLCVWVFYDNHFDDIGRPLAFIDLPDL